MAINVVFYRFGKKINSTKRPDAQTESVTYSCNMLDDCSIINPKISIAGADNTFNPSIYNYAYIASFDSRYYFVSDWTYSQGLWNASLTDDVLASWKGSIGNSKQYITRCQAAFSNDIIDGKYPAATTPTKYTNLLTTPFVTQQSSGTYIVSILGNGENMIGYYAMTATNYSAFANSLFGSGGLWEQLINDLVNPLQYIISVRWFPLPYTAFTEQEKKILFIGFKPIDITYKPIINYSWTGRSSTVLQEHPSAGDLGPWTNCGPYTRRMVYWPPLGEIPLNCIDINYDVIDNVRKLRLYIDFILDIPSGMADYKIINANTIIQSGACKLSVDLPLAGQQVDFGGILSGAMQTVASTYDGNPVGIVSGIMNATDSALPQVMSRGSVGSVSAFTEQPKCISTFYRIVNTADSIYGKPAMFEEFINSYSGYMEVEKPVLSIAATDSEIESILNFMRGGFYYE